jgi:hypothetical protein
VRLGSARIQIVRPGLRGCASLDVLRCRTYLKVVRLLRGRALLVSWMRL